MSRYCLDRRLSGPDVSRAAHLPATARTLSNQEDIGGHTFGREDKMSDVIRATQHLDAAAALIRAVALLKEALQKAVKVDWEILGRRHGAA
jgi:hypothetical protein